MKKKEKEKEKGIPKRKDNFPVDAVCPVMAFGGLLKTNEGLYYTVKGELDIKKGLVSKYELEKADLLKMGLDRVDRYLTDHTRG